jgi:hypothetical protein
MTETTYYRRRDDGRIDMIEDTDRAAALSAAGETITAVARRQQR